MIFPPVVTLGRVVPLVFRFCSRYSLALNNVSVISPPNNCVNRSPELRLLKWRCNRRGSVTHCVIRIQSHVWRSIRHNGYDGVSCSATSLYPIGNPSTTRGLRATSRKVRSQLSFATRGIPSTFAWIDITGLRLPWGLATMNNRRRMNGNPNSALQTLAIQH